MKCNRHPHEQGGGVCASCLRDRLLAVLAAQRYPNPSPSPENHHLRLSAEETRSFGNRCHRFSLFPSLFGSEESESSSWFSALIHRKKKINKEKRVRSYGTSDRGLSPAMDSEDGSAYVSGYATESSAGFRRRSKPARAISDHRRRRHSGGYGFSEFVVCLSPLVRTGHASRRNHHPPQPETSFSGDLGRTGNPVKPNRSRKLAERGRIR